MDRDVKIYIEYLKARANGVSIASLAKKLKVPINAIYKARDRVEYGDEIQLVRCLSKQTLNCKWEHRYKRKAEFLQNTKKGLTVLIKEMHGDGFGVREIGRRLAIDPMAVKYHLKK